MTTTSSSIRNRPAAVALWALQVLLAIVFALIALPKIMGDPISAPPFDLIGLGTPGMVVVGWLELAGAIALLVPRLCGLAAICQIFLMTGATVLTVVQTPDLVAIPALTLVGVCRRLVPPPRHRRAPPDGPDVTIAMTLRLPHLLYLLGYEPAKDRMDINSALVRGQLLRAAAVADLRLAGLLEERDGRAARADASVPAALDPFLREVLDDVAPDRPRGWFGLVDQRWHRAEGTVRDQLAVAGVITVERRRILRVFPSTRIAVTDLDAVRVVRDRVRERVIGGADAAAVPIEAAPIEDAALAVIAMDGHVATVFWRRELRANKTRADALTDRIDRELPGLRKALAWSIAARRTTAST